MERLFLSQPFVRYATHRLLFQKAEVPDKEKPLTPGTGGKQTSPHVYQVLPLP